MSDIIYLFGHGFIDIHLYDTKKKKQDIISSSFQNIYNINKYKFQYYYI